MQFADFERDYLGCVSDIFASGQQNYEERLRIWFRLLDVYSVSRERLEYFATLMDFGTWYENARDTTTDLGDGHLEWSIDDDLLLAQQLWLFRQFSINKAEFKSYLKCFDSTFDFGRNIDDWADRINHRLFSQLNRELFKKIEKSVARDADTAIKAVLYTDIIRSTELTKKFGNDRWQELLGQHDAIVRHKLDRYKAERVKPLGDRFLAVFDSCGGAII